MSNVRSLARPIAFPLARKLTKSASFLPTDLASITLFLDAADVSTITDTADSASQIDDKSGNGNNATQATAALQPETNLNTINGKNVLYFNNDNMSGSASVGVEKTLFISGRRPSPFTGNQCLIELYTGDRFSFYIRSNGSIAAYDGETAYENIFAAGTVVAGAPFIIGIRLVGTTLNMWHNGTAGASIDIGTESATTSYIIGDDSTGGDDDLMDYGAVIVYNEALSDANINKVGNYLSTKWGISWVNI